MKASVVNIRLISRYSAGSYAFAVKGFCALFSAFKIRSGTQFHGCIDLSTLFTDKSHTYLPLPQIVCNVPDSGRHVTSVFQDLSLSRSVGRVGENPGNEVGKKTSTSFPLYEKGKSSCSSPVKAQVYKLIPKTFQGKNSWPLILRKLPRGGSQRAFEFIKLKNIYNSLKSYFVITFLKSL